MKRSTDRILTTHVGSLPRPASLAQLLMQRDKGKLSGADEQALGEQIKQAVADIVAKQADAGLDVVNDGEASKVGYSTYVKERLTGFDGEGQMVAPADMLDFDGYIEKVMGKIDFVAAACTGPVAYRGQDAVAADIANLKAAMQGQDVEEAFMPAASPGVIALFLQNQHYPSQEEYLFALADAMKQEYDAIHAAGIVLQLDCPDLAMGRHMQAPPPSPQDFRKIAQMNVEALNHATRDIPRDGLRMHLCWGNYNGPHHHDVELRDVIDIVLSARPQGMLLEGANPRHAHDWKVFENTKLPDGKLLIPGVIDTTNNYIEHEELIAQRIVQYANLVGRENVMAGADCGFETFANYQTAEPAIAWRKFSAMARGAEIASQQLWS